MKNYRPRLIADVMRKAAGFSPVIVLSGARQTGKSTLLQNEPPFKDWHYITFDDIDTLSLAEKRPQEILNIAKNIVIDEAQRSALFLFAVKKAVDRDKTRRIVLSGSANMLLMEKISETLAGRAIYFNLLPFSMSEVMERRPTKWIQAIIDGEINVLRKEYKPSGLDIKFSLFKGFLPPAFFLNHDEHITMWLRSYIKTYLERDLRDISVIAHLSDFKKMMELLAMRNANILRQSEVARDASLSQATAGRYINLLEATGLFLKLRPYSKNMSIRIIKSPKIFGIDSGLTAALAGYSSSKDMPQTFTGSLLETYVLLNLLTNTSIFGGDVFYFRTQGGKEKEVDFIIEKDSKIIGVEVKASESVTAGDIKNLLFLKDTTKRFAAGAIIYTGKEIQKLSSNIYAIPWDMAG